MPAPSHPYERGARSCCHLFVLPPPPLPTPPTGTMEGGRQAEVSKAILGRKDVPYVVAAPLLIQDLASWSDQGIQGLQVRGAGVGGGGRVWGDTCRQSALRSVGDFACAVSCGS